MSAIAIIPARSGSRGIPHKNIKPFCGVPLVVRTIKTALAAKTVSLVCVTTDSPEYATLCETAGARVIKRPRDLSGDAASSESALLHALDTLKTHGTPLPEWLVFLQCTSPFTRSDDIDALVHLVEQNNADTGLTAVRNHKFLWRTNPDQSATGVNHDKAYRPRRQDLPPEFAENGAVYVMRTAGFLEHKHRFFGKTVILEVPEQHGFEIDSPADWQIAETIARNLETARKANPLPDKPALVVFDFDGVFTDNRVLVSQDGSESVFCDRGDGMAIEWLREANIPALILSKERNPVVEARARKVKLDVAQAIDGKAAFLRRYCEERSIRLNDVVYIGNDLNDLECLNLVGCGVSVADAAPEILDAADLRLEHSGGHGAIRELVELILRNTATNPNPRTP